MSFSPRFAVALLALPLSVYAADTASWTNWTDLNHGSLTQNGSTINVGYTGSAFAVDHGSYFYDVPTSFTSADITNTPGTNGTLEMAGGGSTVQTFTFSQAVIDPVIALYSLGQPGLAVHLVFDTSDFSITSSTANGHWGGGSITQSGNTITGIEGNGLLQFKGSFTSISFATPDYEYHYGGTVGAPLAAVPEPETAGMALAGLMVAGTLLRRRRQA